MARANDGRAALAVAFSLFQSCVSFGCVLQELGGDGTLTLRQSLIGSFLLIHGQNGEEHVALHATLSTWPKRPSTSQPMASSA